MTSSLAQSLGGGSPVAWAVDFLTAARFPVTPENVRAVVSWEYAESGGGGGMWNPLNTTQGGYAGETNANAVGVKNYRNRADGIAANAHVIHNGFYGPVVAAFSRGTSAPEIVATITRSPWGTRAIQLLPAAPPIPAPAPPRSEELMFSFPSATKPPTTFRGAEVNIATKAIRLRGGATMDPPDPPDTTEEWHAPYPRTDGRAGFVIPTYPSLNEYAYLLP